MNPRIEDRKVHRGPPLGRHLTAISVVVLSIWLFWWVHGPGDGFTVYRWNEAAADASVMLLCFTLILGPVARYVPAARKLVPLRRELGIGAFITAGLHVAILLDGGWNPLELLFAAPGILDLGADAAANWVGLVALVYMLVLAATSNNFSQRRLGRGWKFIQRQAYTLFLLTVVHVAVFLYLLRGPLHRQFIWWFWTLVSLTVAAQFAGFVRTVRSSKGPPAERLPVRLRGDGPMIDRTAGLKWVAIVALWGGLIVRVYTFGIS